MQCWPFKGISDVGLQHSKAGKKSYHTPAALVASPGRCNLNSVIENGRFCTKPVLKIGRN